MQEPAAFDPDTASVDAVAAALVARSRSLLREREQIQQRIQAALLKFRPSTSAPDTGGAGAGTGSGMSPRLVSPGKGTSYSQSLISPRYTATDADALDRRSVVPESASSPASTSTSTRNSPREEDAPLIAHSKRFGSDSVSAGKTAGVAAASSNKSAREKSGSGDDAAPSWRERLVRWQTY